MTGNAKSKMRKACDELCCAYDHLNSAYMQVKDNQNPTEIHAALKSVAVSIDSMHNTLSNYED